MTKLFLPLLFVISTCGLAACAEDSTRKSPVAGPVHSPPITKAENDVRDLKITINGESPEVYYSTFLFHPSKFCSEPWYQFAGSFPFDIGQDELGRRVTGDFSILMLKNGTYYGYYLENTLGDRVPSGGYPILAKQDRQLRGRWRIEGQEIAFENLGRGHAMMVNKRRTIQLLVGRNIISAGLSGQLVEIKILNSNTVKVPELDNCAK